MIFIQARSTSKRFPGKVLKGIGGVSLVRMLYKKSCLVDDTYVLIPKNDIVSMELKRHSIPYLEGPEENVLERFYRAANSLMPNYIIRLTADSPLHDPGQTAYAVNLWNKFKPDFATNCMSPCPDGMEVDLMSYKLLKFIHENVKEKRHKEHVTTYIKENFASLESMGYRIMNWDYPYPVEWFPKLSIDTEEDYKRIIKIYDRRKSQCNGLTRLSSL